MAKKTGQGEGRRRGEIEIGSDNNKEAERQEVLNIETVGDEFHVLELGGA